MYVLNTPEDRQQMLWQLGITQPTLPAVTDDPNRPSNVMPMPSYGQNVYADPLGHFVTRSSFGRPRQGSALVRQSAGLPPGNR